MSYSSEDARRNGKTAEVSESIHTLKEDAGKLASSLGAMAKDRLATGREQADEIRESVAETAHTLFSELEQRVRTRPAAALGVTLGAGVLLGLMLAARRR